MNFAISISTLSLVYFVGMSGLKKYPEKDNVIYDQPFSPLDFLLLLVRWYSRGNLLTGTLLGKLGKECKYSNGINVGFQFVAFECLMRKADQILYYWGIWQVFLLCGLVLGISWRRPASKTTMVELEDWWYPEKEPSTTTSAQSLFFSVETLQFRIWCLIGRYMISILFWRFFWWEKHKFEV